MLVLSGKDVRDSLPMRDAIEYMKHAFAALTRGEADVPLRTHLTATKHDGITLVMPARIEGESSSLAVKVVSVFDRNVEMGTARIQAAVIVLDPKTGQPLALLEGATLTAIRTAAASGAATDLLAKPDSTHLAILGAGVQARSHIEAICAIRPISTIKIFSPTAANVDNLIKDMEMFPGREVSRADSAAEAVGGADIVCATTTSSTPVFDDSDLKPGAHINAVGSYTPEAREINPTTVARAWVVVDDREAAWQEAGDLIQPRDAGLISADHLRGDLGELVLDPALRPTDSTQPTLFKSVGIAVQDAVAASRTLEGANQRGLGTVVAW
jgi:ornithine cyclodeaminase/alanine dehydrogenase-like protein (mu-crystallin family)